MKCVRGRNLKPVFSKSVLSHRLEHQLFTNCENLPGVKLLRDTYQKCISKIKLSVLNNHRVCPIRNDVLFHYLPVNIYTCVCVFCVCVFCMCVCIIPLNTLYSLKKSFQQRNCVIFFHTRINSALSKTCE